MKYVYFGFLICLLLVPVGCASIPSGIKGDLDLHVEVGETEEGDTDEI